MILCTDPILKERLKKKQIDAIVFDSILTRDEKQEKLESLFGFASGWFLDKDNQDYTEYRKVSIGGVLSDEVMMLFQMFYNFVWIYNKVESKDPIQFYESESCKIPEPVRELISFTGGETITCSESYSYLCFNKLYKTTTGIERNISVVNLSLNSEENDLEEGIKTPAQNSDPEGFCCVWIIWYANLKCRQSSYCDCE